MEMQSMSARTKKAVFWLVMLVATWLFLEAISFAAYRALNRSWFSFSAAREQLRTSASTSQEIALVGLSDLKWNDFAEVLHPYAGFVADPQQNKPEWKVSDFGFVLSDPPNPFLKRSADKTIVAVFGGSFANWVYLSLHSMLTKIAPTGRQFVVLNFSGAGDKQPQQLMILNYLLALGAEFDVVVNLDGFNDITLPVAENIPAGVNPFFPRGWDRRTAGAINPATIRLIGYVERTKEQKQEWANGFRRSNLYHSPTLFLIWELRDRAFARAIFETNEKIKASGGKSQSYVMHGPPYEFAGEEKLYHDLGLVWSRSSLLMKNLCDANHARYFHFLQPNQYVEGSKPMSPAEKAQAVNERSPYRNAVIHGYPVLAAMGRDLQTAGLNFTDLTMIYAQNSEPVYSDDCCHTNTAGSDIVAQRIIATIQELR
jgi:hypothetical protein